MVELEGKRVFILKKGVLSVGLPVAVLMSLTVAFQKPGFVSQFQGFSLKTFLLSLVLFVPVFSAAGYVWGMWFYQLMRRRGRL